jgi:hypothetical protein
MCLGNTRARRIFIRRRREQTAKASYNAHRSLRIASFMSFYFSTQIALITQLCAD